jgi:CMP-N,N'-diacetyllegionaminic acid synthase
VNGAGDTTLLHDVVFLPDDVSERSGNIAHRRASWASIALGSSPLFPVDCRYPWHSPLRVFIRQSSRDPPMIVTGPSPYLAVIPARAGSRGVPGKNLRVISGLSLVAWSIEHVRRSDTPMQVVVSTDDSAIAEAAAAAGAVVPTLRPRDLATDESPTEPAVLHALETAPHHSAVRHVVLLQPTSPIRDLGSLDASVQQYERSGANSLVSVVEASPFLWRGGACHPEPLYDIDRRPRRQDVAETERRYIENGSIYITDAEFLKKTGNRLCGDVTMFIMKSHEGLDIDTEFDLWVADQHLRAHHAD